jgi:hypothetical protein
LAVCLDASRIELDYFGQRLAAAAAEMVLERTVSIDEFGRLSEERHVSVYVSNEAHWQ